MTAPACPRCGADGAPLLPKKVAAALLHAVVDATREHIRALLDGDPVAMLIAEDHIQEALDAYFIALGHPEGDSRGDDYGTD